MTIMFNKAIAFTFLFVVFLINTSVTAQKNDWQSLFDGKTLKGWNKVTGEADYLVENGELVGITKPTNANTFLVYEKKFSDFILELEFRMDDTVSNSGVQFRSHFDAKGNNGKGKVFGYQVDFDPTPRQWCGGIYDEGRREWLYPLSLNASAKKAFKRGVYNKLRIEAKGNFSQVFINDIPTAVLIDEMDKEGLIALQVHGTWNNAAMVGKKVYWRNIRIRTKNIKLSDIPSDVFIVNTKLNHLSNEESKQGWKLLFDGTTTNLISLQHKAFPSGIWKIEDQSLIGIEGAVPAGINADLTDNINYSAFDFQFEFKMSHGGNSGVKFFAETNTTLSGFNAALEYQLLDDEVHPDKDKGVNGNRRLASLYDILPAQKQARFVKPAGQWNSGRILALPNHTIIFFLNGVEVLRFNRMAKDLEDRIAQSVFKNVEGYAKALKGKIVLQHHGEEVSFRNLKIRDLAN